jgi:nitrate reductase gamma subunit
MTLLDFARGPALQWSLWIFAFGVVYRLLGSFLLLRKRDLAKPRGTKPVAAGFRSMLMRSVPPHELEKHITYQHITGYVWHIGFFVVLFGFAPHMTFFEQFFGLTWPTLPNGPVLVIGAITLAILISLLARRMVHPVLKRISTFDDYASVLIVMAPIVTGLASYAHVQLPGVRYEELLAVHLLSFELLLVWFPFSKLMHLFYAFPARFQIGAAMDRKGVKA